MTALSLPKNPAKILLAHFVEKIYWIAGGVIRGVAEGYTNFSGIVS